MTNLNAILVAYDGSPQSKEALHWAIYFGRKTGAAVSAVKVFEPILPESMPDIAVGEGLLAEGYAEAAKKDRQMMEEVKEMGRSQEIEITTAVLQGHVAQTILKYAESNRICLIVAGTRGHGQLKQLLLGSVTHGLVSLGDIPVLVVKKCPVAEYVKGSLILTPMRKILVAYDGLPQSKAALSWAVDIAKLTGAQVLAVKVFEPFEMGMAYSMAESGSAVRTAAALKELADANDRIMAEAKELAKQQGLSISTQIINGSVIEGLLEYTKKHGIEMIAVGAQGHGILDKLPLGSVPHGLISLSPVPVLVVKQ